MRARTPGRLEQASRDFPMARDSVVMSRLILAIAAGGGIDTRKLARDTGLPSEAAARNAMIPSRYIFRLWELAEHALEDPFVGLSVAGHHRLGELDLYDYMFTTAATLKDGLQASSDFLHLVTTNGRLCVERETDRDITYSYRHVQPGGRGEELCLQFVLAGYCARIRAATGRLVVPVQVTFTQPAPRSYRAFTETFGTSRIDFGAPLTTFTLRAADRDYPMPRADPVLAGILRSYADLLDAPPPVTWHQRIQQLLAAAFEQGVPTLDGLAQHLAVSRRTLQRQFAEHGTTWSAELDTARRHRAERARQAGKTSYTGLASELGYTDSRSARRAVQRWRGGREVNEGIRDG